MHTNLAAHYDDTTIDVILHQYQCRLCSAFRERYVRDLMQHITKKRKMEINELKKRDGIDRNKRLTDIYVQFGKLLSELRKRDLPDEVIQSINTNIDLINPASGSDEQWRKQLRKTQSDILRLIEKELKLVPKNHYRNIWLALGIAAFGTTWCCLRSQPRQYGIYGYWTADWDSHWVSYRYRTGQKSSALNNFTFNLYRSTKVEKENLFISPFSTYQALLTAYAGSEKKTKQEFEKVLSLHKSGTLDGNDSLLLTEEWVVTPDITISNAIWLDKKLVVEEEYGKWASDKYRSDLRQTDFSNRKAAVSDINGWVSEKTNHRIKKMITDSDLEGDMKMVIANAVYFKGEWQHPFNKIETTSAPFFTSVNDQYKIDFMHITEDLSYFENEELQFISKPYRNSDLSFGIVLPKKIFGIGEIEKKLNDEWTNEITEGAGYIKTELSMPKIKLESGYELSDALKSEGLQSTFSSEADFSGITKAAPLQLSKVLHKTWIELDEEKTEAAAATATGIHIKGLSSHKISKKVFKADHPFVFFVFANQSKAILFIGRYVKPTNGDEIEKEEGKHNLEKRKQEKFSMDKPGNGILIVVDNKIVSQDELQTIHPDDIESMNVYKDKKEISNYSSKNYDCVIVVTLKKNP